MTAAGSDDGAPSLTLAATVGGGELTTSVSDERDALAVGRRPWAAARVMVRARAISATLARASRWGDLDRGSATELRRHGRLLFDELLPPSVKAALRATDGGTLTLRLDLAASAVPWELLHTGESFLGLARACGRLGHGAAAVAVAPAPIAAGARRMLVVCDPCGDLMGAYYEGVTLRDELDVERRTLAIDLRSTEVGVDQVRAVLRDYDLVHFAGHALGSSAPPGRRGWQLADGVLSPGDVDALAGGVPLPRLVFANACRSGAGLAAAPELGLANAFVRAGVAHYVGCLWDVPDEPACHMALAFYDRLLAGAPIGRALRDARHALRARYGPDTVTWAAYALYGDPREVAFGPAALKEPAAPQEAPLRPSMPSGSPPRTAPRLATTRVRAAAPPQTAVWPQSRTLPARAYAALLGTLALLALLVALAAAHWDPTGRISQRRDLPLATPSAPYGPAELDQRVDASQPHPTRAAPPQRSAP